MVDDSELFDILEPYLEALEAGEAPDRDEFLSRHPRHREELSACLRSLHVLHSAGARNPATLTGETLGDFRVGEEIGRGGMGIVYEAEQISLGRKVALKVLLTPALLEPARLRRFHTEAIAAARLQHPHIVPVHAVGCEDGIHYYAMQYVEGKTVAEAIGDLRSGTRQPFLPKPKDRSYAPACAQVGKDAADALEHAHRRGVVHRDVKPANLILDERGQVFVADFGLASFRTGEPGVTMSGDLVGTLRYMSPEQARALHDAVDHRTDVYSLGVTLYELLTLERAFPGESAPDLLEAIVKREPLPLRRRNRSVPAALETIVETAMAKEVEDRYATAEDLARDLDRFLRGRPIAARPPTLGKRAARFAARNKVRLLAAAILILFVAVMGPMAYLYRRDRIRGEAAAFSDRGQRERSSALRYDHMLLDEMALTAWVRAADLFRRAVDLHPHRDYRYRYASCRMGQSGSLLNLGRPAEALPCVEEALAVRLELRDQSPEWAILGMVTHYAFVQRARILWELGRFEDAERDYREALRTLEEVASFQPHRAYLPSYRLRRRYELGRLLWETGRRTEASKVFREALEECSPGRFPREDAERAWLLVTCPDEAFRDPKQAVELARSACMADPDYRVGRLFLGAALLRAGKRAEAGAELEATWAIEVPDCRSGVTCYLLSMACSRAGEDEEARRWFEVGKARDPRWQNHLIKSDFRLHREEAAALLGR